MRKYDIPLIFSFKNYTFKVFLSFLSSMDWFPANSPIFPELIFINLFAVILFNISCVLANRYRTINFKD